MDNVYIYLALIVYLGFDVFTYLLGVESIGTPSMFMLCIYFENTFLLMIMNEYGDYCFYVV